MSSPAPVAVVGVDRSDTPALTRATGFHSEGIELSSQDMEKTSSPSRYWML
jgi:hypothetical protein